MIGYQRSCIYYRASFFFVNFTRYITKKTCMFLYKKGDNDMLKIVEMTFVGGEIRRFKDVIDGTFERRDVYMRFKNKQEETIYINTDNVLMMCVKDQK